MFHIHSSQIGHIFEAELLLLQQIMQQCCMVRFKLQEWLIVFCLPDCQAQGQQQHVVVNGAKSKWAPFTSSLPQGMVFGSLLFIVVVNILLDDVSLIVKMFADT